MPFLHAAVRGPSSRRARPPRRLHFFSLGYCCCLYSTLTLRCCGWVNPSKILLLMWTTLVWLLNWYFLGTKFTVSVSSCCVVLMALTGYAFHMFMLFPWLPFTWARLQPFIRNRIFISHCQIFAPTFPFHSVMALFSSVHFSCLPLIRCGC
jgi:hypothetical protein